jgi:hypothetical protein
MFIDLEIISSLFRLFESRISGMYPSTYSSLIKQSH